MSLELNRISEDERTVYEVVEGADLVEVDANGVVRMKSVGRGVAVIQVSFPNYDQARHLAPASVTITLLEMTSITLSFLPFPGYDNYTPNPQTHIKLIDCSGFFSVFHIYQQIQVKF